ncbi:DUF2946 family protein [Methylobacterium sp. 174MFSha1.1]|uniref:DUF2946 family protein n=1 Tax=Methylobacterium sp. 174MFSha1.1 TaxID=1502749 RepID=UPI001FCDF44F|nr:DUF2946 family protein [Methylobacterium sp. 174MFSha1.1]
MTLRAVIAVTALYALALQAILASALVTVPSSSRLPSLLHVLCAPDADSSPGDPAGTPPAHHHPACCTAAQSLNALTAPVLESAAVIWPVRRATGVSWRPEVAAHPRAPPGIRAGARAPPIV